MNGKTLFAASIAAAALAAGCGGDEETTTASPAAGEAETPTGASAGGGEAESAATVDITDFEYGPDTVTLADAGEVTWVNNDDANHTATNDSEPGFDTGTLNKGDEKPVVLDEPGTYDYVCVFHPFMKGSIEVTG